MTDQVKIRLAEPGDGDDIMLIYVDNYRDICPGRRFSEIVAHDRLEYGESYPFLSPENLGSWMRTRGQDQLILVAEAEGDIGGFVKFGVIKPKKGIGYIEEIHVKRSLRGRGIGAKLLRKAEENLRKMGAKAVYVEAWRGALKFFIKNGYIPLGWEPEPYIGQVKYLDLIKLLDLPSLLQEALQHLQAGDYRKAAALLQKIGGAVAAAGVKNAEYYDLISLYVEYSAQVAETRNYHALARQIKKAAEDLVSPFSEVLYSLALEVEGDADERLNDERLKNHKPAHEKFGKAAELLEKALEKLLVDAVLTAPPLESFLTLLRRKAKYYEARATINKQRA